MNKVTEIFKAWQIAYNPERENIALAEKRIEICNSCEFKSEIPWNMCTVCGCSLKGKIYSPVKGACPKGFWDVVDEKN
jgi:hypothetical protein